MRDSAEILDDAVLKFTNRFYRNLFNGELICTAFNKAKAEVEVFYSKGQANMFMMLLEEELVNINSLGLLPEAQHFCEPFKLPQEGSLCDLTDKPDLVSFPATPQNLLGRESDLFNLVQRIASDDKRLVSVVGVPGIGKSSLIRKALHFFNDRNYFTGGIVLIQAKGVETTESLKKSIICEIISQITDETQKRSIIENAMSHPEALLTNVIDYIKSKE